MQIAVDARLASHPLARARRVDPAQQLRAAREHGIDVALRRCRQRGAPLGEQIERGDGFMPRLARPVRDFSRIHRLRIEGLVAARQCKRMMQLGDATSQCTNEREIAAVKLRSRRRRGLVDRTLLEELAEIVLRVVPAVALVVDVRLQQRERKAPLAARIFERTRDGNDIGKMRDVGQKAADFRLGVDAGAQATVDLEEPVVAKHNNGVGAPCAERAHLERVQVGLRKTGVRRGRLEAQRSRGRRQLTALADRAHQRTRKELIAECIR